MYNLVTEVAEILIDAEFHEDDIIVIEQMAHVLIDLEIVEKLFYENCNCSS